MTLQELLKKPIAFVRKNSNTWAFALHIECVKGRLQPQDFFVCDFYPFDLTILRPERSVALMPNDLDDLLEHHKTNFDFTEPQKETFLNTFESLMDQLKQSQFQKAVPVVAATSSHQPKIVERLSILKKLISAPMSVIPYGYWAKDQGLIGATPEILLKQISQTEFLTMAVAGTRFEKDLPSLLDRPKDLSEHQFVIDDITQCLKPYGEVSVGETLEVSSGQLKHLKTEIKLRSHADFMTLLKALHPTAALGAFPRAKGLSWLNQQPRPSKSFGAPFGYCDEWGLCTALVAIRNIEWDVNKLSLGSGCGIVRESQFEKEWEELKMKRQSVRSILGIE